MHPDIVQILTSWVALRYVTESGEQIQGMKPCDLNRSLLDRGHEKARKFKAEDYLKLGYRVVNARKINTPNSMYLPIVTLI